MILHYDNGEPVFTVRYKGIAMADLTPSGMRSAFAASRGLRSETMDDAKFAYVVLEAIDAENAARSAGKRARAMGGG